MKNKIIVANNKSFIKYKDINNYILALDNYKLPNNIIICPSSLYLTLFINKKYSIGLQNISFLDNKNLTGEISYLQIKDMNIKYVIIGHNDRRIYFNENQNMVNYKIKEAINNGLKVILCTGEQDKNSIEITKKYIEGDIVNCLKDIRKEDVEKIIIAYEPNWSVGTGEIAQNDYISNVILFIKDFIKKKYGCHIKVLYGGSININNIKRLVNIIPIDGFLIGESSTKIKEFLDIIEVVVNQ